LLVGVELMEADGLAREHARPEAPHPRQRRAVVAVTARSV
jgi:hypothetical protein